MLERELKTIIYNRILDLRMELQTRPFNDVSHLDKKLNDLVDQIWEEQKRVIRGERSL